VDEEWANMSWLWAIIEVLKPVCFHPQDEGAGEKDYQADNPTNERCVTATMPSGHGNVFAAVFTIIFKSWFIAWGNSHSPLNGDFWLLRSTAVITYRGI